MGTGEGAPGPISKIEGRTGDEGTDAITEIMPEITVVVPVFNARQRAKKCLASLVRQNYENYEIILVDDCSSDGTYELVKRSVDQSKRTRIRQTPENLGAAAARNLGIKEARGEYIAFTDCDCVVDNHWVEGLIECLITKKGEVAGGGVKTPQEIGFFARSLGTLRKPGPKLVSEDEAEDIPTCNAIFKKALLERMNCFDETFESSGGEDTDLCARIKQENIPIYYTPKAIVWHYHKSGFIPFIKWRFNSGIGLSRFARKHFLESKFAYNLVNLLLLPSLFFLILVCLLFKPLLLVAILGAVYLVNLVKSYLKNHEEFEFSEVGFGVLLNWLLRGVTSLGFLYGMMRVREDRQKSRKKWRAI